MTIFCKIACCIRFRNQIILRDINLDPDPAIYVWSGRIQIRNLDLLPSGLDRLWYFIFALFLSKHLTAFCVLYFSLKKTKKTPVEDPFVNRVKAVLKKCSSLRLESLEEAQLLPTVAYLLDLGRLI